MDTHENAPLTPKGRGRRPPPSGSNGSKPRGSKACATAHRGLIHRRAKRRLPRRRSAATDVSVKSNKMVNYTFRRHDSYDAETDRLRDEGKPVVSIGWSDGGKTIEDEAGPEPSNKN